MLKPSLYCILPVKKCCQYLWSLQTTSNTAADTETEERGGGNEENETQQVISEKHTNMTAGAGQHAMTIHPSFLRFSRCFAGIKQNIGFKVKRF